MLHILLKVVLIFLKSENLSCIHYTEEKVFYVAGFGWNSFLGIHTNFSLEMLLGFMWIFFNTKCVGLVVGKVSVAGMGLPAQPL